MRPLEGGSRQASHERAHLFFATSSGREIHSLDRQLEDGTQDLRRSLGRAIGQDDRDRLGEVGVRRTSAASARGQQRIGDLQRITHRNPPAAPR